MSHNLTPNNKQYYRGNDLGYYQFITLEDIISNFQVSYVGDDRIIPRATRLDIAFHAQRAAQELSFDTLRSIKSQQIDLPPSLVMPLPHDYVNYTKISWTDTAGIKHPLYPTKHTSNPFQINQKDDGSYNFDYVADDTGILENSDFSGDLADTWQIITKSNILDGKYSDGMAIEDGKLKTSFITNHGYSAYNFASVHTAYQAIDVTDCEFLDISALGTAENVTISDKTIPGTLRFGLSTQVPEDNYINNISSDPNAAQYRSNNVNTSIFDLKTEGGDPSYLEWISTSSGTDTSTDELLLIDVSNVDTVYAVVVSFIDTSSLGTSDTYKTSGTTALKANFIDDIVVTKAKSSNYLIPEFGNEKNSSTWNNYKSTTPSENNNDDYEDDVYWPYDGERYGLEPSHAQTNGSFFIDNRLGRIHFSSNISGKTVILDYISDGLAREADWQIHKFAEEAMYKWIAHAIISTSSYGQPLVPRLTREKFAAVRKAKLRLSNIKLEELTQMLRGKSKWIKH